MAHKLPQDMSILIGSSQKLSAAWSTITPHARNEWICWVISPKKDETRRRHLERMKTALLEGNRRPCCWAGCIHR